MILRSKILLIAASFLFSATLSAQHIQSKIKSNNVSSFLFAKSPSDTIYPASFNSGTPVLYSFVDGGYCFGNSPLHDRIFAQKYEVLASYRVYGVALWIGAKEIVGDADSLSVNFYRLEGPGNDSSGVVSNAPDTAFQTVKFSTSQIDTTDLTFVMFPDSFIAYLDYAVGIDVSAMTDDTIGLVSTSDGDAMGTQLSWVKWSDKTWHTILDPLNWALDIDLGIFVIVDMTNANIEDDYFINGIKLGQNQPNPASDNTIVMYEVEEPGQVNFSIYDIQGKCLLNIDEGQVSSGIHSISLNTLQLTKGVYFYQLRCNGKGLAKKMMVTR